MVTKTDNEDFPTYRDGKMTKQEYEYTIQKEMV